MDSFALRRPPWAAALDVFEIDHPATQEFKRRRLADRGIPVPAEVHFVAADLSETGLDAALAAPSFRSDQPTFFSSLGVTPYLTRDANLTTLHAIASCSPAGSEAVFSYTDQRLFGADTDDLQEARATVASAGEPWISGFHPGELGDDLRACGLELLEDLGPEELNARYCSGRTDGLVPSPHAHVAHARVAR